MLNTDMVLRFLQHTRKSVESENNIISQNRDITNIFDSILYSCTKNIDEVSSPTLIISETYNKYSQLLPVRLKNKVHKYFILYDCHLQVIMERFVTIMYSDEDPAHDVWKLAYELFGEEMILNENQLLQLYFTLNDIALGPYQISIKENEELNLVYQIQKSYVLAHEVGHWLFSMTKEGKEDKILNLSDKVDNITENTRELLREIYEVFDKQFKDKYYSPLIGEQKRIVYESDRIVEECFADSIAYSYIEAFVKTEYGTKEARILAVKSLYILMMSMQILAISYMTFNNDSFENSTSIRIAFLRQYLVQYYEDMEKEYYDIIEEIVERFENRITNIILESFNELEERAMNIEETIPQGKALRNIMKELRELICDKTSVDVM